MIFPIRPITTETRRVDDVNVRATPAVTGITAAHGFNQPGVVVTIGDGARTLARSGQQPQSGDSARERRAAVPSEGSETQSVFDAPESEVNVEAVFNDEQATSLPGASNEDPLGSEEAEPFKSVWESEPQTDGANASGVPYAALQRAASVQDLDVGDVAQALANTQIAVRVLATQEKPATSQVSEQVEADEAEPTEDSVETSRLSSIPTDGVPYEALQRAVTEAENAQTAESVEKREELMEPVFLAPENGGAPWGRAVPFEEEVKSVAADRSGSERQALPRKERSNEAQAQA